MMGVIDKEGKVTLLPRKAVEQIKKGLRIIIKFRNINGSTKTYRFIF